MRYFPEHILVNYAYGLQAFGLLVSLQRPILFLVNLHYIFHRLSLTLFLCFVSRPLTLLPIQRCHDTIDALKNQLTSYTSQVCSTCILEDVDNHYWADPKPFYEVKFLPFYSMFFNNLLLWSSTWQSRFLTISYCNIFIYLFFGATISVMLNISKWTY